MSQDANSRTASVKQGHDRLGIATDEWLNFVKRRKLPTGKPLPGNAFKIAEDIASNPARGFNRKIFDQTGRLEAWPAIATIAAATGLCRRTVERMIRVLRGAGCLSVQSGRGRHNSDMFCGVQVSHFRRPAQSPENATGLSGKCDSPVAENATTVSHDLSERPSDKKPSESERDAVASPRAPAVDQEGASCGVGITTASPVFTAPELNTNVIEFPGSKRGRVQETQPASNSAGAGDDEAGKRVHSRSSRAGNRTARRGATGKTPLPDNWNWMSQADFDFAVAEGYGRKAITRMALRFRHFHQSNGTLKANWPATWRYWVTGEAARTGGERKERKSGNQFRENPMA